MTEVSHHADHEAASQALADTAGRIVQDAIAARGVAHIALAGGSSPRRAYELLAQRALPWANIQLWWGDGRTSDPPAYETQLGPLAAKLSLERIMQYERAATAADAAAHCERDLVAALGTPPRLDLVVLGLGGDGHTASLMPHAAALSSRRWVDVEGNRITLTPLTLNAARHVRFIATGADKAAIVARIASGPRDPQQFPAQLVVGDDVVIVSA